MMRIATSVYRSTVERLQSGRRSIGFALSRTKPRRPYILSGGSVDLRGRVLLEETRKRPELVVADVRPVVAHALENVHVPGEAAEDLALSPRQTVPEALATVALLVVSRQHRARVLDQLDRHPHLAVDRRHLAHTQDRHLHHPDPRPPRETHDVVERLQRRHPGRRREIRLQKPRQMPPVREQVHDREGAGLTVP